MTKGKKKMSPERFIPYDTIFKLDERLGRSGEFDTKPRKMVCLNCEAELDVSLYLKCCRMHRVCTTCKMTADEYWGNRSHRKVANATG